MQGIKKGVWIGGGKFYGALFSKESALCNQHWILSYFSRLAQVVAIFELGLQFLQVLLPLNDQLCRIFWNPLISLKVWFGPSGDLTTPFNHQQQQPVCTKGWSKINVRWILMLIWGSLFLINNYNGQSFCQIFKRLPKPFAYWSDLDKNEVTTIRLMRLPP